MLTGMFAAQGVLMAIYWRDALGGGKVSVGPPFFEAMFVPIAVPLLLACTMGAMMGANVRVGLEDSLYAGRGKLLQ